MTASKISFAVIIPVFNGAAFVAKAIESCLKQTVLPNEIIVVDDGSTDATETVVRSFQSHLIRFLQNEKNSGPSLARNLGMRSATSSWILFLDADDIFHPRKTELVLQCIQHNKSIRAIGHSFNIIKADGSGIELNLRSGTPVSERLSVFKTLLRNPMVTPSLAVAAANEIYFNEQLKYAEDHDFIVRTAEKFGLWYIDIPLCSLSRIPLTAGGISSHKWEMRKGEMRMFIDYCKRNSLYILIPLLIAFSLIKHLRNFFIFSNRS
jgi:glycosyltransferase involved in cell wall biosynthesis